MDNSTNNQRFGTKWFTFYTKVRPWLACLASITLIADLVKYPEAYLSNWWMMLYFIAGVVRVVLCIMVFVKSQGYYEDFVHFVKGVLLYETISMAYDQAVNQYIESEFNFVVALVVWVIVFVLGYFLWYRINVKYFNKRINAIENDYLPPDPNRMTECKSCGYRQKDFFNACPKCGKYAKQYVYLNNAPADDADKIRFCRKCGEKLIDDSRFCSNCGSEVVKE